MLAPTPDLVILLSEGTGSLAFLIEGGVDTDLLHPQRRGLQDRTVVLGHGGRLRTEKNLRLPKQVENALRAEGSLGYRFEIVDHGSEAEWLRANLRVAHFSCVLLGAELARAYADMDVFLFPSRTDIHGNVVWESSASGGRAVVTGCGGPQHIVRDGQTGIVDCSEEDFVHNTVALCRDRAMRRQTGERARQAAVAQSWDAVFDRLYDEAYAYALAVAGRKPPGGRLSRWPRKLLVRPLPWRRACRRASSPR